jgi:hypothetical protein
MLKYILLLISLVVPAFSQQQLFYAMNVPASAGGGPHIVQICSNDTAAATSWTITCGSNITAGDSLVFVFLATGGTPNSITGGDTWTPDPNNSATFAPPYSVNLQYYVNSSIGGYTNIGFSITSGGTQTALLAVYELSNMQVNPRDTSVVGLDSTSTTPSAGSITTAAPREILFAALSSSGGLTTMGFACGTVDVTNNYNQSIAHFTETAAAAYSDCWLLTGTGSDHFQTFLSAYKGN